MLSAALLTGVGLNYFCELWMADAIAGVLIALYLAWEVHVQLTNRGCGHCGSVKA